MKILLVDDEEKNLKLLEAMLAVKNYNLFKAANGKRALELLEQEEIDMVLLDVMLPDCSGIEILKKIRENSRLKIIPVILITGLAEREDKLKGLKNGADDYISKPFDMEELLIRVDTQARLFFLRRQINEKERFEKVIESIEEGVIVTDLAFLPLIINNGAHSLLGINKQGKRNLLLYLEDEFKTALKPTETICRCILHRPGNEKYNPLYLATVIYPIKDALGKIESYVFVFRNITDEYIEDQMKNNFFSLISNKFRTPVTSIGTQIELVKTLIKNPEIKKICETIEKSHKEIENLFSRLLDFLDLQKKSMNEYISTSNIEDIIIKIKKRYKIKCNIEKNIDIEHILYWWLIIFEELLDNSFKFSSKGRVLKISIVLKENSLEISDNGMGIPPEKQRKIYEPFYQIEREARYQFSGVGLGLSFVKRLVEQHMGNIEIESKIGEGTTFKIWFKNNN